MAITVESPRGEAALVEMLELPDRVYATRAARWPTVVGFHLPVLTGDSPFAIDRTFESFVAREGGDVVARVVAVVDERYRRVWKDGLGHLILFEAMPGARAATKQMMDAACVWLREHGSVAARAGMGVLEFPFATEDFETLPPFFVRQNPAYYQSLLKDAGFESEQGLVDYRIRVTPENVERWKAYRKAGLDAGFSIVPLAEIPAGKRVREFMVAYNEPFLRHWGYSPFIDDEIAQLFEAFAPFGILDHSVIAYRGGEPMGALWVQADASMLAQTAPGRALRPEEHVNFLGIAVLPPARGQGLNLAMAANAYLRFADLGYEHVSYTIVLDHNWPSRRTAEKLGAVVCNNYLAYRRELARRA
jgi:hypothetical protein